MIATKPKGHKDKLNGMEWDAMEFRHVVHHKPGIIKRMKRAISKRFRKQFIEAGE